MFYAAGGATRTLPMDGDAEHSRKRAKQCGGGHDESARMFKPKYFQMY